ncbi:methionyl-tRNA formyltransferase [Amylibacter sp. SFDW26]|uniref:methionyl-tRNA formyltransferase n=1 Tax=Amylibacter sp. SFDW26 TaxID=2652722 RepID=UPI00126240AD|nr:methionyl-tRNA formyltransferase [Amylibacter sp. SFDW26]KAB7614794.1 methionyl-tRNA formyltransferase [Amylibacter sp. SFDW26]
MRIVFMGTPDFSVPVLDALVKAGHEVVGVYSQPPRPAGRGKKERPSPVQAFAETLGLPVYHPLNFKDAADVATFEALNADVAVVVAYGLILPQVLLDAPKFGCLNIHASLLPRWRGAAPIHRAIMAGDTQTGVCIMQMEAGLDTGPVLLRDQTDILTSDTTLVLHDRLADMGADLILRALDELPDLKPEVQSADGVTFAEKIDKAEAKIDWAQDAETVDRLIRGLSPFPGAWCQIDGQRVKVLNSCIADDNGTAGVALDDALTVACGTGAVQLLRLQRAGKGAMDTADFMRGLPVAKGTQLS